MSTLSNDLRLRIAAVTGATPMTAVQELREEIEHGCFTPDERGELDELLAEAVANARQPQPTR